MSARAPALINSPPLLLVKVGLPALSPCPLASAMLTLPLRPWLSDSVFPPVAATLRRRGRVETLSLSFSLSRVKGREKGEGEGGRSFVQGRGSALSRGRWKAGDGGWAALGAEKLGMNGGERERAAKAGSGTRRETQEGEGSTQEQKNRDGPIQPTEGRRAGRDFEGEKARGSNRRALMGADVLRTPVKWPMQIERHHRTVGVHVNCKRAD